MELAPRECGLLDADVAPFAAIAGDRRTGRLLGDVIHGIGGESPVCAQIAADPPLNVLGIGTGGRRGLLYPKLSSSAAADLPSEPAAVRAAVRPVGAALAPRGADLTAIDGSGFGDRAIRGGPRDQGMRLVCRLKRRDRLVRPASDRPVCHLGEPAPRPKVPAHIGAEPVVRKTGQPRPKRQPATAAVSSVPVRVPSRRRTGDRGEVERERACWLAEVRPERVEAEPRWLLTDRPVETAAQATAVFRTYCRRWAIEGAFEIAKQCPGWEDVQVLADEAM